MDDSGQTVNSSGVKLVFHLVLDLIKAELPIHLLYS